VRLLAPQQRQGHLAGLVVRRAVVALGAIAALLGGCGLALSEDGPVRQQDSVAASAGLPVVPPPGGSAGRTKPTAAELDERERLLSGPRPAAGPPLRDGDVMQQTVLPPRPVVRP
jgi:hypothetical protein